jgi:Tetratricopeptide repeat
VSSSSASCGATARGIRGLPDSGGKPHSSRQHAIGRGRLSHHCRHEGFTDAILAIQFRSGCRKAILLAPDDAEAHNVRAQIHAEAGEVEQALARYDQAIALNPSNSNILVNSVTPLLFIGRVDVSIDRIERAKGIDPF